MSRKSWIAIAVVVAALIGVSVWAAYVWYNQVLPQSAVRFLRDVPAPQKGQIILVFTPHPDDETIAAVAIFIPRSRPGPRSGSRWSATATITVWKRRGMRNSRRPHQFWECPRIICSFLAILTMN